MLQEDSNGETSFEIIEKKNSENSNNGDSLSGVSSPYSIPSPISAPPVPPVTTGNLLSNIHPPSNLPGEFMLWQTQQAMPAPTPLPPNLLPPSTATAAPVAVNVQPLSQPFPQAEFSAAIPPSKGAQHGLATTNINPDVGQPGGGLISWVKDAVSSGGILSKVAEKAKNSMDSLITTLDPQMTELIYSGGDLEVAVASKDPEEIAAIREATFAVFGKAWINGVNTDFEELKHQPVGFEAATKIAEDKIGKCVKHQKIPTVAVENILLSINDNYFNLSLLLLKDPLNQISFQTYSQTTPIPVDMFLKEAEKEMPVYFKECDSKEKILSAYLNVKGNSWQQSAGGVSRKESLFLAAKTLMTLYKNKITFN